MACASRAHRFAEATAYHGSGAASRPRRAALLVLTGLLGLAAGGCSMSMQLESLFSDKDEATRIAEKGDARDITGSLPMQATRRDGRAGAMTAADWTFATAALREALDKSGDGASAPWQNPTTGARGTVTPVASAYAQDGFTCRNFLASQIGNGQEGWFEGTACRSERGKWDIRTTRPLQKS